MPRPANEVGNPHPAPSARKHFPIAMSLVLGVCIPSGGVGPTALTRGLKGSSPPPEVGSVVRVVTGTAVAAAIDQLDRIGAATTVAQPQNRSKGRSNSASRPGS